MTGADKFGLPRPIDDQVLVGMKTLTHESGFVSPKIYFSRYQLCRVIGWQPDGRAYARLEESFDRIAGTTLKFKDAWFDNEKKEYKLTTFSLISQVDLCSRDQLDGRRAITGSTHNKLCSFIWTEVIWKSFQDGFIRTLDMTMFRRIAKGRRRDVPLRLFRILDKRFYYGECAEFELRRLCVGTFGLSPNYSPAQMMRVLDRAAAWLVQCGYLDEMWYGHARGKLMVYFRRRNKAEKPRDKRRILLPEVLAADRSKREEVPDNLKLWLVEQRPDDLAAAENRALSSGFGSDFERTIVWGEKDRRVSVQHGGRVRQEYVRRYMESENGSIVVVSA